MDYFSCALKEAGKICYRANNLAFYIRKATGFQSSLIYYEEIIFFYVLNDIRLSLENQPVEIQIRVKDALLKILSHTDNTEYKKYEEIMDLIIDLRSRNYYDILLKYNEKCTPDFFTESFLYQAELINFIQENNSFMDIKQKPCSFSEWVKKSADNKNYQIITNVLKDNYDMMLDFIDNNIEVV